VRRLRLEPAFGEHVVEHVDAHDEADAAAGA
jgi:hypothetical protein